MNSIWQDIRFGVRMLFKHKLTTLVCVVALALGIGANTAMFSVAEAFLLHPAPFENADRIVALVESRPRQNIDMNSVAPATYLEWRKEAQSFDQMGAYAWDEVSLTGDGNPQKVQAFHITANFFEMLGVQPQLGRAFLRLLIPDDLNADHQPEAAHVSHGGKTSRPVAHSPHEMRSDPRRVCHQLFFE